VRSETVLEKNVMNSWTPPLWKNEKDERSEADAKTRDSFPTDGWRIASEYIFMTTRTTQVEAVINIIDVAATRDGFARDSAQNAQTTKYLFGL
jgi:hypothetical protein